MADPIRTVLVEQKLIYEERIAELRKERDEARRENEQLKRYAHYCRPQSGNNHKLRSNIDRTDLPLDVIDDIRYAYGEIMRIYKLLDDQTESTQKALQERDEARRIACGLMYDQATSPNTTKQSIAEAEGWDCFAENTNG